ncbi:GNAT family N-acetyltransferase [Mangrovibacillus cuniculi]|uniref:GNAT family N-acetyltransferase n=1 Tax=Mangrovibacillus cuniculi TaxID=2593652 RepID=A0A7S8C9P8_9BACI|nr:GNAT family N-acetyltransferase [Mangrovibacillus cuniculi]QPC45992.1 GNAT family N-acetyltransferase [Mangrovibacillus cuniculi]
MTWFVKEFEELSVHELYDLLALRTSVFVVEQECPYQEVDGVDKEALHIWKMEDGIISAYARLIPTGVKGPYASIGRVIVNPDFRGKNVGHILIEECMLVMQEKWEPSIIKLQAQAHLQNFYGKHGFSTISDEYDEDGIPHVDMIWEK